MTILLVEDSEMNRDMLQRRLQRRGFEIALAENGAQGVEVATATLPKLILMDMSLPIMDGWQATKRLKSNPRTAHIPIIALTAHAMSQDREQALNAGCDAFATKPVDFPALVDQINRLLETE